MSKDLTDKKTVISILSEHKLWLRKGLGQNFLVDKNELNTILDTANLDKNDTVLEIGPGIGTMTVELCPRVKKVIAIEIDEKMIKVLKENVSEFDNLEIVQGNSLDVDIKNLKSQISNLKIVANIPYNITSPILRKFLENEPRPERMTLLLQKEVAERICAPASDSKRGYLTVLVKYFAVPEIIKIVEKQSFFPVPRVDSAIANIRIKEVMQDGHCERSEAISETAEPVPSKARDLPPRSDKNFFRFVKIGFSQKRKKLINSLSAGLEKEKKEIEKLFKEAGIEEDVRAEDLRVKEWINLFKCHSERNEVE